jgi:hypothetical protein
MEFVIKPFGKNHVDVRVPLREVDSVHELRKYNDSIRLANELTSRIQRLLTHTFEHKNWRDYVHGGVDRLVMTRYPSITTCANTITGLAPECRNTASGLSALDNREEYRGCLGLFWESERVKFDGDVVKPLQQLLDQLMRDTQQ